MFPKALTRQEGLQLVIISFTLVTITTVFGVRHVI